MAVGFLNENNGNKSMGRLLSLLIILSGLGIGVISAITKTLDINYVTLSLGLVTIGLTGKVISKGIEG